MQRKGSLLLEKDGEEMHDWAFSTLYAVTLHGSKTVAASTEHTYKYWSFSVSRRIGWNKVTQSVIKKNKKKQVWRRSITCASSHTSSDSNLEAVQTKCGCETGQKHGKMPKCRWMSMWFTYLNLYHVAVWPFVRTRHQQETGSTDTRVDYTACIQFSYKEWVLKKMETLRNEK